MTRIDTLPALRRCDSAMGSSHERIVDLLMDVLLDADEMLEIIRTAESRQRSWLEPRLQRIFDDVDHLMKRLSDGERRCL